MKKLLVAAGILAFVASVAGCETSKGVGKDLENTGENIRQGVNATESSAGSAMNNTSSGMGAGMENATNEMNNTTNSTGY